MDLQKNTKLLASQQKILTKIALGEPLHETLASICLAIEALIGDDNAKCSILKLIDNLLYSIAGPSIPDSYSHLINGLKIGPAVGSCGTAAFLGKRVLVEDIPHSPLWENFKSIAEQYDFKACWSTPIISTKSEVLGTFAIYYSDPKVASKKNLELIDYFVHLSSIAIEKSNDALQMQKLVKDLKVTNQNLNAFIKVIPDPAIIITKEGLYLNVYAASENLLSDPINELVGKNIKDILSESDALMVLDKINKTLETNEIHVFEYTLTIRSETLIFEGRTIKINYNNGDHVLWVIRDITRRKNSENEVKKLVYYDSLTSLPNRRLLNDRIEQCVVKVQQEDTISALLFLDIDNFKRINDSLGHAAGDQLLIQSAKRLSAVLGKVNTLARIGGDEFVILVDTIGADLQQAEQNVIQLVKKVQSIFNDKFDIGKLAFQISASIGIYLIDKEHANADNILKFADTAMYRTKFKGGNGYSFFDPKQQTLLEIKTELESEIVRAIENDEFCAYFQPQVDVHGKVSGAEALIRWNHPSKGLVPPYQFIPLAEQFGLIQKLQNIVLHDICKLLNQLAIAPSVTPDYRIAINMSQNQFNSPTLKDELISIIDQYKVPASLIKLEITETMLSNDLPYTVQQMHELKNVGFTFSIDDFGTGYSCLSTLHAYPVDELKIDKSFIDNISNLETGLPIVETIINLAKNLNISVMAEGVETKQQFDILKEKKSDGIQGYLIAKPMSAIDYINWHKRMSLH
ncbi:bifunctional diguanylate cyclase/phosphodiesterase [Psychromonas sp. B3M02]|uniref:sensor domain-containing phosphodiesterase n=1 Tax=Psychromonas sp. B3M02 TaxID=2267226 RepID=UPI000DEA916D|nr:EAL domain-containing protein [Psychromonas sp. B3M02]RBW46677.1 bifunctional diguanylate cyclase/phosphodiesterase [Psychromonas sp. B3M02]